MKKRFTIVAKPKSNVVRIDRDKAAVMKSGDHLKLRRTLERVLNDDGENKPSRKTAKKRSP
jgi:hypothetical protein